MRKCPCSCTAEMVAERERAGGRLAEIRLDTVTGMVKTWRTAAPPPAAEIERVPRQLREMSAWAGCGAATARASTAAQAESAVFLSIGVSLENDMTHPPLANA